MMQMLRTTLFGIGVVLSTTFVAHASPEAVIKPRWHPNEPLVPNRMGCDFVDDAMSLFVTDGGKELAQRDFCSSYGRATAKVAADRRGRNYVLLEYSEGRGTNASTTFLAVYRLAPELLEVMRIPISWATGPTQRFVYQYDIEADQSGGLRIALRGNDETGSECCVPLEKVQIIRIDASE
jgi:hypothetical protein